MKRLRVALGCLTVLPVGATATTREADLGGSFLWFPLVGLLIGVVLVGVNLTAIHVFPPLVVGACVLLAWIVVTGALHLDGLGDVCDGLCGGHTPEERLRIMKDPHLGAMAVVAIAALLLLKFALLSSIPQVSMARALLLAPCIGRYAMVLLGTTLPYARTGGGTGEAFVRSAKKRSLIGATAMALPVSWVVLGPVGLGLFGLSIIGGLALRSVFRHLLGGITGDAMGATGELMEVVMLLGVALARS